MAVRFNSGSKFTASIGGHVTRRRLLKLGSAGVMAMVSNGLFQDSFAEDMKIRIPITMCHGLNAGLTLERFRHYLQIASDFGFSSINYDQLYDWLMGKAVLPARPIMFDFDHPVRNIRTEIFPLMEEFGFKGNLFVNSGFYDQTCDDIAAKSGEPYCATWDQVGELMDSGWTIGAHTHTHPDLSDLAETDTSGELIGAEMDLNNELLKKNLGLTAKYFAFTGGSTGLTWSKVADQEAKKRYKLGRLWIVGQPVKADGKMVRYADFVGVSGPDKDDGGPPDLARYITRETPHFRLPSMELQQALIYEPAAFRQYLSKAVNE